MENKNTSILVENPVTTVRTPQEKEEIVLQILRNSNTGETVSFTELGSGNFAVYKTPKDK
ncbi:hypothetical protein KA001_01490 [Patescibacteria group bacterium]|nr:hypothetical protein [Patescibacteria group bacterium]